VLAVLSFDVVSCANAMPDTHRLVMMLAASNVLR
jgi:hypothetical protein